MMFAAGRVAPALRGRQSCRTNDVVGDGIDMDDDAGIGTADRGWRSGSLVRAPTSFGEVRLIRQAVWLVGSSANEFRRGTPHETGSLDCHHCPIPDRLAASPKGPIK